MSQVRVFNFFIFRSFFGIVYPKVRFRCSKPRVKITASKNPKLTFLHQKNVNWIETILMSMYKCTFFSKKTQITRNPNIRLRSATEKTEKQSSLMRAKNHRYRSVFIVLKLIFFQCTYGDALVACVIS